MDEILQKLLSSELLSEEAKAEISTQWTSAVDAYKANLREEVTMTVRAEISEQWTRERDALVESVETFVEQAMQEEIKDLKGDIERFRDLEAEYAEKIVEEKHAMAQTLSEELDQLVDKIDAFFEYRLTEELEELKEDLDVVKQNQFGRKIFEAFASEYGLSYVDEDAVQAKLSVAEGKLADATKIIKQLEESRDGVVREVKLEKILAPLNGRKKEQMAFVLANVETSRLEEAYTTFIGRVLKEEPSPSAPGASAPITESVHVATGDQPGTPPRKGATDSFSELKKLAGMQ